MSQTLKTIIYNLQSVQVAYQLTLDTISIIGRVCQAHIQ